MSELAESLRRAIMTQITSTVHTSLPGKIESYDYTKQKAIVKPLIKKKFVDGSTYSMPVIKDVPVIFPRSGGASLTFPVNPGDTVLLCFSEKSLENWLNLGGEQEPGDNRIFNMLDAFAIPGLFPFTENSFANNNSDVLLVMGDARLQMTPIDLQLAFGTATLRLRNGQVALGTPTNELLDLLIQLIDAILLMTLTVSGSVTLAPPINAAIFTAIKSNLTTIKGTI